MQVVFFILSRLGTLEYDLTAMIQLHGCFFGVHSTYTKAINIMLG